MKKLSLIVALFSGILLLQNCAKDTVTGTATSTQKLFATINDSTWSADTINAAITYNSALKTKTFTCTGIADNKEVIWSIAQNSNSNTAGFPLQTFSSNASGSIAFSYFTAQGSPGNYVFVQHGTISAGSGTMTITAIDSVKKVITGTFSCTSIKDNYDSNGNIVSVNVSQIADGAFNELPYTFISK